MRKIILTSLMFVLPLFLLTGCTTQGERGSLPKGYQEFNAYNASFYYPQELTYNYLHFSESEKVIIEFMLENILDEKQNPYDLNIGINSLYFAKSTIADEYKEVNNDSLRDIIAEEKGYGTLLNPTKLDSVEIASNEDYKTKLYTFSLIQSQLNFKLLNAEFVTYEYRYVLTKDDVNYTMVMTQKNNEVTHAIQKTIMHSFMLTK
ncbi:MAG: hypothetical protein ACRC5M_02325 [Anaeroplasmataceae bacterium]